MMAGVLLALAIVSGLASGTGFMVLGVTDMKDDPADRPGTFRRHSQGLKAFAVGVAGLIGAVALAFMAGRV